MVSVQKIPRRKGVCRMLASRRSYAHADFVTTQSQTLHCDLNMATLSLFLKVAVLKASFLPLYPLFTAVRRLKQTEAYPILAMPTAGQGPLNRPQHLLLLPQVPPPLPHPLKSPSLICLKVTFTSAFPRQVRRARKLRLPSTTLPPALLPSEQGQH